MSNTIRIKRRASGAAGAPASLENAELAFNEVDDVLYYGKGTGGAGGTATTVIPIAGPGQFVDLSSNQTIGGTKTFSNTISGSVDGNAATATKLETARTLSVSGDATGSATFDGSANSNIALTLANVVTAGTAAKVTFNAKGLITGTSSLTAADIPNLDWSKITTGKPTTLSGYGVTDAVNVSEVATVAAANKLLKLDAASKLPASITGNADGNAATATKLATARTLALSGDATGSGSFDGSANATIAATLATVNSNVGTFTKVTVNGKGLVTAAVQASRSDLSAPTGDVSNGGFKLTNVATPIAGTDAANKDYVDSVAQGLDPKQSVRAASTANISSLSGPQTIDGISLVAGDRVLVKDQTTASQNGIYVVAASAWSRSNDANVWDELVSAYVFVESGTTNADNGYLCTVDPAGTLGTTAVTWVQFSGAGQITAGAGLSKTGNTLDVVAGTGITVAADNVALTGQALALNNLVTNGLFTRTGAGTVAARSIATSGTGISVSNGDGVSGNPTLSLSAALSTVGGLTPAADQIAYYTGVSSATLATLTSFGRSLIDDADAAAGRTTLGLGTMATQNANSVAITGGSITNLTTFDGITIDGGTF